MDLRARKLYATSEKRASDLLGLLPSNSGPLEENPLGRTWIMVEDIRKGFL